MDEIFKSAFGSGAPIGNRAETEDWYKKMKEEWEKAVLAIPAIETASSVDTLHQIVAPIVPLNIKEDVKEAITNEKDKKRVITNEDRLRGWANSWFIATQHEHGVAQNARGGDFLSETVSTQIRFQNALRTKLKELGVKDVKDPKDAPWDNIG